MNDVYTLTRLKQEYVAAFDAFPDVYCAYNPDEMIAEGDKVVVPLLCTSTHESDFFGIPPTGKKSTVAWILIYRIEDGKIAETRRLMDTVGVMQQMGFELVPPE